MDAANERMLLINGEIVTPDRVISGGSVLIENGMITEVSERSYAPDATSIDLGGRLLMPGIICLHNDAIEQEINPRPTANHDPDFALLQLDRKLAAAGITTQFHAVSFLEIAEAGARTIDFAISVCEAIERFQQSGLGTIDHHSLFRLEVRTEGAFEALLRRLEFASIPLISIDDHIPGRGQLRNIDDFKLYLRTLGKFASEDEIDAQTTKLIARVQQTEPLVNETFDQLGRLVQERSKTEFPLLLKSHDDDTPERVDQMYELGCRISEFPTSVAAAKRARELGMTIEVGAPNALRGRSLLPSNASALELYELGLVDVFLADYYAPALLASLFRIADRPGADLAAVTRCFTLNPANSVGLTERGSIEPGKRADLIVVEPAGALQMVSASFVNGKPAYSSGGSFAVSRSLAEVQS
ncbi:alpha-D-ribose 1-methylphosphonate 5-triphosphate diphosphatase [soil metagenome]